MSNREPIRHVGWWGFSPPVGGDPHENYSVAGMEPINPSTPKLGQLVRLFHLPIRVGRAVSPSDTIPLGGWGAEKPLLYFVCHLE
jgi:hypothetical protein